MHKIFSQWVSSRLLSLSRPLHRPPTAGNARAERRQAVSSALNAVPRSPNPYRLTLGNAHAERRQQENSAPNAAHRNLRLTAGPVRAAQSTRASSAQTAEPRSQRAHRSTAVTSADGSPRILIICRSSAQSAEIRLTAMM